MADAPGATAPHIQLVDGEPLQAVILAAGYGRRMRPLSDGCHKALLPLNGTTILGRIMDSLVEIGTKVVTVVTGYRADDVEGYLRTSYPDVELHIVDNPKYRETNNVVSLSLAFDSLSFDADVMLIECDLMFDSSLLKRLLGRPGENVALVDQFRIGMDGTVVAVRDGFVTDVYPTDTQGADFSYGEKYKTLNIYRFDRAFCSDFFRPLLHTYSNSIDPNSYYELILGMLANLAACRIKAEIVTGERWAEVDDPNDLVVARFQFEPDSRVEILDKTFGGHWNFDVLDFSLMRNAHFPTPAMLAAMRQALPELVASYGSTQTVLNEKLGYFLGTDPATLQVLHGASQVFPLLAKEFEGRRVTVPAPTFGEYPRHFPNAEPYRDDPGVDWEALERAASSVDVVVVVNPNTPTGTLAGSEDLMGLARSNPGTLILVDESFFAFSGQRSIVELLRDEPLDNVLVLVSMSKTLGIPGLRLGYVHSNRRSLIDAIGAQLPVWNVSAVAEYFLETLLKFGPAYEASLVTTIDDRAAMRAALEAVPVVVEVPPSGGNFLLVRLCGTDTSSGARVRSWLLTAHAIEVKDVSGRFGDGAPRLRVAVRRREENDRLVDALGRLPVELLGALTA